MCHGVEMTDVTGTISSRRVDDAYVDDTDTYATAPETNSPDVVIENLTDHTQIWTMLVAVTGGLLVFHKCMWQILVWIRVGGEYLLASNRNIKGDISSKTKEDIHTKSNEWKQQNPIRA
jgi:hypothetical protein